MKNFHKMQNSHVKVVAHLAEIQAQSPEVLAPKIMEICDSAISEFLENPNRSYAVFVEIPFKYVKGIQRAISLLTELGFKVKFRDNNFSSQPTIMFDFNTLDGFYK